MQRFRASALLLTCVAAGRVGFAASGEGSGRRRLWRLAVSRRVRRRGVQQHCGPDPPSGGGFLHRRLLPERHGAELCARQLPPRGPCQQLWLRPGAPGRGDARVGWPRRRASSKRWAAARRRAAAPVRPRSTGWAGATCSTRTPARPSPAPSTSGQATTARARRSAMASFSERAFGMGYSSKVKQWPRRRRTARLAPRAARRPPPAWR